MTLSRRIQQRMTATYRPQEDSGAVAILVAILSLVLFGMAAFAVDLGYAYSVKRQLSVTADASALAGAQAAGAQFVNNGRVCDTTLDPVATTAATELHNDNGPSGSDGDPTVTVSCETDGTILVEVNNSSTLDTFFAGVLGVDTMNPQGYAVAQVTGSPGYGGLRPFAVCLDDFVDRETNTPLEWPPPPAPPPHFQYGYDFSNSNSPNSEEPEATDECNFTPAGNWGLVDFDGGSNGNPDLVAWTASGYDEVYNIDPDNPESVSGNPGGSFSGPLRDALTSIIGTTVLFPVAGSWNGEGGSTSAFTLVGAVSAEVCGFQIGTRSAVPGDCWDQTKIPDDPDSNTLYLQWTFQGYSTSFGGSGDACELTSTTCVPTVRLWE